MHTIKFEPLCHYYFLWVSSRSYIVLPLSRQMSFQEVKWYPVGVFRRYPIQILAGLADILIEIVCGFSRQMLG